jgi:hypothetical protein
MFLGVPRVWEKLAEKLKAIGAATKPGLAKNLAGCVIDSPIRPSLAFSLTHLLSQPSSALHGLSQIENDIGSDLSSANFHVSSPQLSLFVCFCLFVFCLFVCLFMYLFVLQVGEADVSGAPGGLPDGWLWSRPVGPLVCSSHPGQDQDKAWV